MIKDVRFPTGYRTHKPERDDKGQEGGSCNVNACQLPDSAHYYNTAMNAFYCYHCARQIQYANPDMYFFNSIDPQVTIDLAAEQQQQEQ
jgi:hypothetical protein